jgi:hypothetical protein
MVWPAQPPLILSRSTSFDMVTLSDSREELPEWLQDDRKTASSGTKTSKRFIKVLLF